MPVTVNTQIPTPDNSVLKALQTIDFPTLGHFLETGFVDPQIRRLTGQSRLLGRAITVRITATDSTLVHKATALLEPGDVLVIDTGGDARHAPVGGVVGEAVAASGAAGVVIDGVCTDIATLRKLGLAVYARGTSVLTTKLLGLDAGGINIPVTIGGATVQPGDIVCGDENGVLAAPAEILAKVLKSARDADESEPDLVGRVRAGEKLPALTAADKLLAALGVDV